MNTSVSDKPFRPSWAKFSIALLITLLSSFMVEQGIGIAIYSAFANFMNSGGRTGHANWLAMLGLILFVSGNLLLGLYLNFGWRGLISGFISPMVGFGAWWLAGSSIPALNRLPTNLFAMLAFGITAAGMIAAFLVISGRIRMYQGIAGLALGIVVGMSLSFWLLRMIEALGLSGVTFIWVWLSAVFFSELLSKRAGWRETLLWLALMFASPFFLFGLLKIFPAT